MCVFCVTTRPLHPPAPPARPQVRAAQEQHELRQAHRQQVARLEAVCAQLRSDVTHCEQLNHELQERVDTLATERLTQDDRMARALREKESEHKLATASLSLSCQVALDEQRAAAAECAQLKREHAAAAQSASAREQTLRTTVEQLQQRIVAAEAQHTEAAALAAATQQRCDALAAQKATLEADTVRVQVVVMSARCRSSLVDLQL